MVGFLFSPCLLNYNLGNGNITICDSWEVYFSPFPASQLIEKNPIRTSPQIRITSNPIKISGSASLDFFSGFAPGFFQVYNINPQLFFQGGNLEKNSRFTEAEF
jgi:hypothetical protein